MGMVHGTWPCSGPRRASGTSTPTETGRRGEPQPPNPLPAALGATGEAGGSREGEAGAGRGFFFGARRATADIASVRYDRRRAADAARALPGVATRVTPGRWQGG